MMCSPVWWHQFLILTFLTFYDPVWVRLHFAHFASNCCYIIVPYRISISLVNPLAQVVDPLPGHKHEQLELEMSDGYFWRLSLLRSTWGFLSEYVNSLWHMIKMIANGLERDAFIVVSGTQDITRKPPLLSNKIVVPWEYIWCTFTCNVNRFFVHYIPYIYIYNW